MMLESTRDRPDTGRIQVLPDALVDQIAAGEVIERPASVVKELLENAIDAGARRVRIEVRNGGNTWVAVTDDGSGMSPGDARLSLERHATSKLSAVEDLARIASFGFRGEALPAIASVSRLRLVTRSGASPDACEIRVDAGRVLSQKSVGAPKGTRVEVADLFAAVPARRKFLKKPMTEWGHVADWVGRLALALPAVHIEIQRDDRPPLVWPAAADPLDRIAAVLSEADAAALVSVEREEPWGQLSAFISRPDRTRPNTTGLYLFVNGRPVRDRLLRHAILEVYRDLLPRGRFPIALLYLVVPPESVDPNVHPAKWEVRFAEPQAVHQLVRRTAREALMRRSWLGSAPGAPAEVPASFSAVAEGPPAGRAGQGARVGPVGLRSPYSAGPSVGTEQAPSGQEALDDQGRLRFGELRLIGQLLATYLVVESKDGLILVDQHAAHERVLYERLRAEWLARGVERQGLLVPETVELEAPAAAAIAESAQTVRRLGFEAEGFGENAVVVRALPALLSGRDPASLIRNLAHELLAMESLPDASGAPSDTRLLEAADRAFASLACHAARRAGDHLELREQQNILEALDAIPWAPTCPHGRPVAVGFDQNELERRFGRR